MSYFQKLGNWFLKDAGKNFVFASAVATSVGIACVQFLPHTIFIDQYKEIVHLYKNGFTVPMTQQLSQRFDKTLELLQIPEKDKKQFKPFMVYGFDIYSAGTFFSRFGVIVGIPINYTYIDVNTIDTSGIRINDHSVAWDMDEGKLFLKSLTLSEKAQMFAMAREIEMKKTPKFLADTITSVVAFIAAYGVGNSINTKYNYYAKPRVIRFCLYALLGGFAFWNYIFIKDFTQLHYEEKVDTLLRDKNPIFKEGGKEYYHNIINRNIALRKLMGKVGENAYTILGNENYLIRQKHLPLVQRKSFFESETEKM